MLILEAPLFWFPHFFWETSVNASWNVFSASDDQRHSQFVDPSSGCRWWHNDSLLSRGRRAVTGSTVASQRATDWPRPPETTHVRQPSTTRHTWQRTVGRRQILVHRQERRRHHRPRLRPSSSRYIQCYCQWRSQMFESRGGGTYCSTQPLAAILNKPIIIIYTENRTYRRPFTSAIHSSLVGNPGALPSPEKKLNLGLAEMQFPTVLMSLGYLHSLVSP